MSAVLSETHFPRPPLVKGIPLIGSTFKMMAGPAKFFYDSYRAYGPCFRVAVFGHQMTVIAGAEAANFMGTREGKECLRSREAWEPMCEEMGIATGLDLPALIECAKMAEEMAAAERLRRAGR